VAVLGLPKSSDQSGVVTLGAAQHAPSPVATRPPSASMPALPAQVSADGCHGVLSGRIWSRADAVKRGVVLTTTVTSAVDHFADWLSPTLAIAEFVRVGWIRTTATQPHSDQGCRYPVLR
jgi:hypothetical protein